MDRTTKLDMALKLALNMLIKYEPPDSRGVSPEFVSMAAVSCNVDTENCIEIIEKALNYKE